MEETVKNIISNQIPCFFISPHPDDAVLSAGILIKKLAEKTNTTVINVFTKAHNNRATLSAKTFLKQSGYRNAAELYEDRVREDNTILKSLGVKVINFKFTDALWRLKSRPDKFSAFAGELFPEFLHTYPTYRFHVLGKISSQDSGILNLLKKDLNNLISKKDVVFCPLGVGGHVDHLVVKKVCEDLFMNLIYWEDFPYNASKFDTGNSLLQIKDKRLLNEKAAILRKYRTQFLALFPKGQVPVVNERYRLSGTTNLL